MPARRRPGHPFMDLNLVMGPQQGLAALASVALEFPFDPDMTMAAGFFLKSAFPTINRKGSVPFLLKELTYLLSSFLSPFFLFYKY